MTRPKKAAAKKTTRSPQPTRSPRARARALAPRLQRLARAIGAAVPALAHANCHALLEFYVDAESRGENARALYPAVWTHLQECSDCRAAYEILCAPEPPLSAEWFSAPLAALPFLAPADPNAAWNKFVRARTGGAPLGFGFTLHPTLWTGLEASQDWLLVRGSVTPEKHLLLSDWVTIGTHHVAVTIWAQRQSDAPTYRLDIALAAQETTPLPQPLQVTITWNAHQVSQIIQGDTCVFENIPLSASADASDLRIEFQVRSAEDPSNV
jgi:hypothetical protein